MTLDISAIRQRIEKATQGEWKLWLCGYEDDNTACGIATAEWQGWKQGWSYPDIVCDASRDECHHVFKAGDAELIVHAPADLRALCDEVERLRVRVQELLAGSGIIGRVYGFEVEEESGCDSTGEAKPPASTPAESS